MKKGAYGQTLRQKYMTWYRVEKTHRGKTKTSTRTEEETTTTKGWPVFYKGWNMRCRMKMILITMRSRHKYQMRLCYTRRKRGCALCNEKGNYNYPLLWWKANYYKYPHVWMLAERILSIPATSAPSEWVFSAASNVINKKRARLTPENAGLILFLRGNKTHVDWT
jgi:hypothetical protein